VTTAASEARTGPGPRRLREPAARHSAERHLATPWTMIDAAAFGGTRVPPRRDAGQVASGFAARAASTREN
jgi:hypothetical protein